jgi:hypothetical protein
MKPLLAVLLLVSTSAFASPPEAPVLPDYEKEARIVFQGMCDGAKISYTTYYKSGGYVLEVARIQPAGMFYFMKRYMGRPEGWEERYFMQSTESPIVRELSHDKWDEKIREISPNYFNKLHDLTRPARRCFFRESR